MNTANATSCPYLMIGYGNTLRCDDGVGYRVAEIVAGWNLTGVRSLSVHQLTPELADDIANAEVVLFADATTSATLAVEPITLACTGASTGTSTGNGAENSAGRGAGNFTENFAGRFTGHYAEPRSLLGLAHVLYNATPTAYQILIPAVDVTFGETFSSVTQRNVSLALAKIKDLINPYA